MSFMLSLSCHVLLTAHAVQLWLIDGKFP